MSSINKSIEKEIDLWVPRAGIGKKWRMTTNLYEVSFWVMKYSKIDFGDGCTTVNKIKILNWALDEVEFYGM